MESKGHMTQDKAPSVLSRKTQAHRIIEGDKLAPEKALSVAALRACDRDLALHASGGSARGSVLSLTEVLESLPEKGLIATLNGPGQALGLVALDTGSLSALVEQLTMGRVLSQAPEERRATRTDAALLSEWIGEVLRGMVRELIDAAEDPVAAIRAAAPYDGYSFGHLITDPRPLALMLEDVPFRVLDITIGFGEVARPGRMLVAMVEKPTLAEPVDDQLRQEAWRRDMAETLSQARAELTAVLHRTDLPIGKLRVLAPGDLIAIPAASIGEVRMEASDETCVALARLGQSMGQRAVRLICPPDPAALPDPFEEEGSGASLPPPAPLPEEDDTIDLDRVPVTDVPNVTMPDLPDIDMGDGGDLLELDDLPALDDLPDLGADTAGDLPGLDDLPDLDALPDLADLAGDGPESDFPSLDDLPDLGGGGEDFPALGDLPTIT